jgi:hypothetical protein
LAVAAINDIGREDNPKLLSARIDQIKNDAAGWSNLLAATSG